MEHMKLIRQLIYPVLLMASGCATAPANVGTHTDAVADFKSCAKPHYPAEAVKAGREGTVTLAFEIGVDGKVVESKVRKSSGYADLDEAARTGIALCTFKPASENGKLVQAWVPIQYVWTLK